MFTHGKFIKSRAYCKNHTALDDGIVVENKSNTSVEHRKCIFWQTSINDQRPKLRVYINGIKTVGWIDISVDISLLQNLGIQIGLFKRQMFSY